MPSLDYAHDVIDLFKENNTDYVLIVPQKASKGKKSRTIVFYSVQSKEATKSLGEALHYIAQEVMKVPADGAKNIKRVDIILPEKNKS